MAMKDKARAMIIVGNQTLITMFFDLLRLPM